MAASPVHVPEFEKKLDLLFRLHPDIKTRRALATRMGLKSASNFSAWSRGTDTWRADHVPNGRLSGLADAFGIPPAWLTLSDLIEFEQSVTSRYTQPRAWQQFIPPDGRESLSAPEQFDQAIRFCSAPDGVSLAYATTGQGTPLVKTGNWLNHLEHDWYSPVWRHLYGWLAERHLLLRYDPRGTGLSDWDVDNISFEAFVEDLEAVVDAAGFERFGLFGTSQGCSLAVRYAATHPERVNYLILLGGLFNSWSGMTMDKTVFEGMIPAIEAHWGHDNPVFRQAFTTLFVPDADQEQMQWFNELQRVTVSPTNAARILGTITETDARNYLKAVEAPTLVLHSREDAVVAFDEGRHAAATIPDAQFVPLSSRNHLLLENEPAFGRFREAVSQFVAKQV